MAGGSGERHYDGKPPEKRELDAILAAQGGNVVQLHPDLIPSA